jgi:molybdopterin-guanine dinucleotide biosynthesis protein A
MDLPLDSTGHGDLSAVILCGGQGRRLGGFEKAYITNPQGLPLWLVLARTLQPLCEEIVFVMRREQAPRFRRALDCLSVVEEDKAIAGAIRMVFDEGRGPARALLDASKVANCECLLVTGVDHPSPDAALIHALWASWAPKTDAVAAKTCVGKDGKKNWEPLWALYRRSGLLRVAETSDWNDQALRTLLARLNPVEVTKESGAFASINDLDALRGFACTLPVASS